MEFGKSSAMVRFSMQFQSECRDDLEDGVEAGAALAGERLVKTLPRKTGIARDLCHPLGARNVPQRFGDEGGIAVGLFNTGLQVGGHLLRGPEVFGDIVTTGLGFSHRMLLQIACETHGNFDISGLSALVTTRQKNNHLAPALGKVDPVSRSVIDPQL